jgi:hypothetical protein
MGSAGVALRAAYADAPAPRVEDAAFGQRWLELAHTRRFDLRKSLVRALPLDWLHEPDAAATGSHPWQDVG